MIYVVGADPVTIWLAGAFLTGGAIAGLTRGKEFSGDVALDAALAVFWPAFWFGLIGWTAGRALGLAIRWCADRVRGMGR